MKPIIVIPARMASVRLPGKPLADICGEPMIVHVWRRATEAAVGPVVVAAAEPEIVAAVEAAGGTAVLTRADHPSGSDRVCEAVESIDQEGAFDTVINLQGDFPTMVPGDLASVLGPLADPAVDIATLANKFSNDQDRDDPNKVKAAIELNGGRSGRVLYFSRTIIPAGDGDHYHHIGIYAFRREALRRFINLPPAALEKRERLEQLRALAAGMRIDATLVDSYPMGVDTPADLERVRAELKP
jgi:3-deoxy-manno-octulosonate cytidylyltransferase (CMP-KDO synthetase)